MFYIEKKDAWLGSQYTPTVDVFQGMTKATVSQNICDRLPLSYTFASTFIFYICFQSYFQVQLSNILNYSIRKICSIMKIKEVPDYTKQDLIYRHQDRVKI